MLVHDTWLHLFHDTHHTIHHRISKLIGDMLFDQPFFYLGMRDSICGCGAVSHDKPRRTELYSSEIAHDTDEDIRQIVAVDLSEDGLAGC